MKYDRNMFDIQIAEGASAGSAVGRSSHADWPLATRSDVRGLSQILVFYGYNRTE